MEECDLSERSVQRDAGRLVSRCPISTVTCPDLPRYCYVLPYPIKKFFKFDKNRCYIRRMERLDAVPFVRPQILSLVARTRMCRITHSAISRRLHVTASLLTQCQNFGYTSYRNGAVSTSLASFLFLLMYITVGSPVTRSTARNQNVVCWLRNR